VGKEVRINAVPFRVVGVAPEGFTGVALAGPDFWMPLGVYGLLDGRPGAEAKLSLDQRYPGLMLVGRLQPGVTMAVAQTQLESLATQLAQEAPEQWKDRTFRLDRLPRANIYPGPNDRRRLLPYALFLMGVSTVVLLIACLNLAGMYLVRGASRGREIAIRMANGASRARIVRQLLVESLLLAMLGGVLGLGLAHAGAEILNASISALLASFIEATLGLRVGLDIRVLLATLAFCGLATVLSGLRPALRLSRRPIFCDLKEARGTGARPAGASRRLVPAGLSAACQVALSVVLVMAAGLLVHSAIKAARATPGYDLQGKLVVEVDPRAAGYDRTQGRQVCESLARHPGSLPGVEAAGLSTSPLFELSHDLNRILQGPSDGETEILHKGKEAFAKAGNVLGIFQQDPSAFLEQEQQRKAKKLTIAPHEIEKLIAERNEARSKKNWKRADEIRDHLASQGIVLEDGPQGTTWRAQ
jgi:hypothetical protein